MLRCSAVTLNVFTSSGVSCDPQITATSPGCPKLFNSRVTHDTPAPAGSARVAVSSMMGRDGRSNHTPSRMSWQKDKAVDASKPTPTEKTFFLTRWHWQDEPRPYHRRQRSHPQTSSSTRYAHGTVLRRCQNYSSFECSAKPKAPFSHCALTLPRGPSKAMMSNRQYRLQ